VRWEGRTPWPQVVVDGGLEEEVECSTARNRSQGRWAQGKRRSNLWVSSLLSALAMGNQLMQRLVSAFPMQVYSLTDRGARACPSVNKSQMIGETGMRRCRVSCSPLQLSATSCHFRNRGHDCLRPHVSCGAAINHCLGNAKRDVTTPTPRTSALP
jgi:hypothetical protein